MKFFICNYLYKGIAQALVDRGHEVVGYKDGVVDDQFNWWQHLVNENKCINEYTDVLSNQIHEHRPDVYVCGKGWHMKKWIHPKTTEWIRKRVGCTVYWSLDDPDFVPTFKRLKLWKGYDVALTCDGSSIPQYKALGLDAHLFWPAWDQVAREAVSFPEEEKRPDFLIVGTPYTITTIPRREIAAVISATGMDLKLYGSDMWLSPPQPGGIAGGYASLAPHYRGPFNPWHKVHRLFARAKMNLSNHIHRSEMYLNDRVPMVMGTGGFLFIDRQPGLDRCFEDGKEVVFFDSLQDLTAKAIYYKDEPELRAEIGAAAREKTLREHTYERRVEKLLEILEGRGMK